MSAAEQTEPRRLTPTERLHEVTMAAMTRPSAPPESSVSFTRNAKGVTQIDIVVRDPSAADAFDIALALYERARATFPLPSGYVGAEGEPAAPTGSPATGDGIEYVR